MVVPLFAAVARSRSALSTDTASLASPRACHGPQQVCSRESASGPVTRMRRFRAERQQVRRSFLSNTMDLRATSRAAARFSFETRTRFSQVLGHVRFLEQAQLDA